MSSISGLLIVGCFCFVTFIYLFMDTLVLIPANEYILFGTILIVGCIVGGWYSDYYRNRKRKIFKANMTK